MNEIFPLVNDDGVEIGCASREECHSGSMLLHPVVHLHVINSLGEIFLQKRGLQKDIQPGKWDTSVGGHVDFGEIAEKALFREAKEELGLTRFTPYFLGSYIFESEVEREYVYSYITVTDQTPTINPTELEEGHFWKYEDVLSLFEEPIFTDNFRIELNRFRYYIEKQIFSNVQQD